MAYVEHGMWEILDVLRRFHRGESKVAIARSTGRSRNTVKRYIGIASSLGFEPFGEEPTEVLACQILAAIRPGQTALQNPPEDCPSVLSVHQQRIKDWLHDGTGKRGLKLSKIHRLLHQEGITVTYSTLYRFAKTHCDFKKTHYTVLMADTEPGEAAEVDFGRMGLVYDAIMNKERVAYALIVTLNYSRHQYVHMTFAQKTSDVIEGLERAWNFFGGTPRRLVIDNMKAAVIKSDRYDPAFQRTFNEYAEHRGFIIDATVARHPTGKPHVERAVQYVRENFFRGELWLDIVHVQREADRWCRSVAGVRKHGTTLKQPLQVFEDVEKASLQPFDHRCFDPPHWAQCTVHKDHHIQFEKALYSVPTRFIGKTVIVRGDKSLVRIFADGQVIKTHARCEPGKKSTDFNDYPKEQAAYAMRDPARIIEEAKDMGNDIGRFAEGLLTGDFPWSKLRQAQQLIRLATKYGQKRVDDACHRALAFNIEKVSRVESIVRMGLSDAHPVHEPNEEKKVIMLPLKFLRPASSFSAPTFHHNQENHNGN